METGGADVNTRTRNFVPPFPNKGDKCLRCGVEFDWRTASDEELQTGVCVDCWDPDKDPDPELDGGFD